MSKRDRKDTNTGWVVDFLEIKDTKRVIRFLEENGLEFSPWMREIALAEIEAWEKEHWWEKDAKAKDEKESGDNKTNQ